MKRWDNFYLNLFILSCKTKYVTGQIEYSYTISASFNPPPPPPSPSLEQEIY